MPPLPRGDVCRGFLAMTSVQVDPTGTPDNAQAPPLSLPVTGGTDLAAILDGVHDAVLAFDGDWRIGYLNAAAVAWLGGEAEDLLGRSAWMVLPDVAVPLLVETCNTRQPSKSP